MVEGSSAPGSQIVPPLWALYPVTIALFVSRISKVPPRVDINYSGGIGAWDKCRAAGALFSSLTMRN